MVSFKSDENNALIFISNMHATWPALLILVSNKVKKINCELWKSRMSAT
jgi:hypothetical protein